MLDSHLPHQLIPADMVRGIHVAYREDPQPTLWRRAV
jgi:hypothetical protein